MGPKKKGGKKGGDDWDEGLGEVADPIAAAAEADKNDEAAEGGEDGDTGGMGGLMAALKKNKGKRQKKGKVSEDPLEGEDPPGVDGAEAGDKEEPIDLSAKAPEEATMDDEEFAEPAKKGKGGKGGKQEKKTEAKADEDEEEERDASGKVMSKKEKEKAKKEREKQRKKEQAAKKKTATPAPAAKAEVTKPVEEAKPEPAAPTPAPEADKGGKKKKVPAALAALQKQQEERKKREEEEARLAALSREEEEARLKAIEEEENRKAEAKAAKKLKEKQKIEQLKKEGKYLTPAQKEQERLKKARHEQMLASGVKVAGLEGDAEKPKKPSYNDRKKKGKKEPEKKADEGPTPSQLTAEEEAAQRKLEELKIVQEQAEAAQAATDKAVDDAVDKMAEDDDGLGDWEAEADAMEGVKDSWDAETDDEQEKPSATRAVANGKPVQDGADSKAAVNGDADEEDDEDDEDDDSEDDDSEDESEDETQTVAARAKAEKKAEAAARREERHQAALAARSKEHLRSPICCILGHVDTGKTKLLDKIRQTNVQEGEAGGITQQIGATFFPTEALQKKIAVVNKDSSFDFKVPGILVIDTPGHESFTNLRSRGSSLCNIAILVVDIMHGLEPQTLESMKLLRARKTPFIVALNKIDRLYDWRKINDNGFQESLAFQKKSTQQEFANRLQQTKLAFAEQGFNSELYYENKNLAKNVSLVPTSAHTGEGIPDLLKLLVSLTQERMSGSLMYLSEVECTVLEVKVIEGLGTTIDVVLSNGVLHEGDRIGLCGTNGPIWTNIRALLTPAEMKELRVKSQYVHNKEIKAAMGIKIAADGLDQAIAGSRLLVAGDDDDEEDLGEDLMGDIENLLSKISKSGRGVSVQASTLGSLEALLEFLKQSKIPVYHIGIGPVFKRDVTSAGVMLEKAKEYAVMLCFDVKVDKDAAAYANEIGVRIFEADIIYHLFDAFTKHMKELEEQKKEESKLLAVFPVVIKPVAIFNKTEPIVIGVDVIEGNLRLLTPICAVKTKTENGKTVKDIITLGRVASMERDHKAVPLVKKGSPSVAVKIEGPNQPLYGRHLEQDDILYSLISRKSIDTLKEFYRADVSNDEWNLIKKLKPILDVD